MDRRLPIGLPTYLLKTCVLIAGALSSGVYAAVEWVGSFDESTLQGESPWELVIIDERIPVTEYSFVPWQGVNAIEAVADASMSMLARPVDVDLEKTPVLCWRWWVEAPLQNANMQTKAGDDYVARVYVTFDLPDDALGWATRMKLGLARRLYSKQVPDAAFSYVWDNRHPEETQQANAYTDRTWMVVQRSGAHRAQQWVEERRDVLEDLQEVFDSRGEVTLVALASDTDNTDERARAFFADLHFISRDDECRFPED